MSRLLHVFFSPLLAFVAQPVAGEVTASSESGFVSHNEVLVDASPSEAWAVLLRPAEWWNGEYSYSGDSGNITIAPIAGGCFCEVLPGPDGALAGQVEHMRVLYAGLDTVSIWCSGPVAVGGSDWRSDNDARA